MRPKPTGAFVPSQSTSFPPQIRACLGEDVRNPKTRALGWLGGEVSVIGFQLVAYEGQDLGCLIYWCVRQCFSKYGVVFAAYCVGL